MPAFFSMPMVLAALQWLAGFFLKRWPKFPNAAIPIITYILGLIGFAVIPQPANAAFGSLFGSVGNIFAAALVQNLFVTGGHGTWKNTVGPALFSTINSIFKKA